MGTFNARVFSPMGPPSLATSGAMVALGTAKDGLLIGRWWEMLSRVVRLLFFYGAFFFFPSGEVQLRV